jgi:hypothetical protein
MRNSILIGLMLIVAAIGGVAGYITGKTSIQVEIDQAWEGVTVVADGTLIANPAAYAYNPQSLADAHNVRIINNSKAAASVAYQTEY